MTGVMFNQSASPVVGWGGVLCQTRWNPMIRLPAIDRLQRPRVSRGRLVAYFGVTIAILGAAMAGRSLFAGGREFSLVGTMMAAWCATSAWRQRERTAGRHRIGWTFVSTGAVCAAMSLFWWFAIGVSPGVSAGQLPGHAGMLGAIGCFIVAGALLRPPRREATESVAIVLDLMLVIASLATIVWVFNLEPLIGIDAPGQLSIAFALAHIVLDAMLVLAAVIVAFRLSAGMATAGSWTLPAAFAGLAAADLGWTAAWTNDSIDGLAFGDALKTCALTVLALVLGRERRHIGTVPGSAMVRSLAPGSAPAWRLWVIYPLIGVVLIQAGRSAFDARQSETAPIVVAAALVVVAMLVFRQAVEVREARSTAGRLSEQIDRDPLTGLVNYRRFNVLLEQEIERRHLSAGSLAVALIDVDRFKEVNDRFGHLAGDHVLKVIAASLVKSCRTSDIVARYAGDEFALVVADVDAEQAHAIGDRILGEIRKLSLWAGPDAESPIGVSIGFAISTSGTSESAHLVAVADDALYRAKRSGRNRCTIVDADTAQIEVTSALDPRRLLVAHPVI